MYDVLLIGLGSMGSSTLYQLAMRGVKVLGIEQFGISHNKGSHSGQTRIVRKAYFEHPDYVPLLEQSYKGWDEIYERSGTQLFYKNGLAYYGPYDHAVMNGIKSSANQYKIELDRLTRKPHHDFFNIPNEFETLVEPDAGFALSEETIKTYTKEAEKLGAELCIGEEVVAWDIIDGDVEVKTTTQSYRAKKLIITAGSYIQTLLPDLSFSLTVTGQILTWLKVDDPELFHMDNFPCWVIADEEFEGVFYGFPILDKEKYGGEGYLKLAQHYPAKIISPEELSTFDTSNEQERMQRFIKKYLPTNGVEVIAQSRCMYTNTIDEHFLIDVIPDTNSQIIIGTGFSGHGFKFVPVIGEILADLATLGKTELPIDLFRFR